MFSLVAAAATSVIFIKDFRWITFGHFEAGCIQFSMNSWLTGGPPAPGDTYCDRMTAPDPIRPICPICQTPLARERQTRTMQPDISQTAVTEKEFDVWVCPKDRSHEPELHITDV